MTGRKRLLALSGGTGDDNGNASTHEGDAPVPERPEQEAWVPEAQDDFEEAPTRVGRFAWVLPTLAVLAVLAWTGFFGWVHRETLIAGASPLQWSRWIVDWAIPVVLVVGLWLLAMRNSRRESARFAEAAQALSSESRQLESRLAAVNRELSLAREFIAAQSRDLESLGRLAAERLSQNADRLQSLIRDNGDQVEAIGRVSETALANMDRLRDDLPVIANSARDVTSQIGNAGETARRELEGLTGGLERLAEAGDASGQLVASVGAEIERTLAAFQVQAEQFEQLMGQRFAELAQRSSSFRAELDGREVEAFAAMRRRADALQEQLAGGREAADAVEREALAALSARIAETAEQAERVAQRLREGEAEAGERWSAAIGSLEERLVEAIRKVSEIDSQAMANARQRLSALREEAARVEEGLAQRAAAFDAEQRERDAALSRRESERLAALEERLAKLDAAVSEHEEEHLAHVAGLAERSEALAARLGEVGARMAELAREGQQAQDSMSSTASTLAARLANNHQTLAASAAMADKLTDDSVRLLELIRSSAAHSQEDLPRAIGEAEARLSAFESQARALSGLIAEAGEHGAALARHVAEARSESAAAGEELASHEARLAEIAARSEQLAERAREELRGAIATLEEAARKAMGDLQDAQAESLRGAAEEIGTRSAGIVAEALRAEAEQALAGLEEAARMAGESGRQAAVQLRDQLARVNELAGNLEQRVAQARERAEEQVDSDFARRMALITESLNSNAIDITKAFDNDVADTAWASYLRGDRGIFTRRAVRLLDAQEARAVSEIYEADGEFRETVNRYIHDFEAMLRTVLSTRDGHAMAVTLLGSDMGKLYVALAQAIERLRK